MQVSSLNQLPPVELEKTLTSFCGSQAWVRFMTQLQPFHDEKEFVQAARRAWFEVCKPSDWLEAFTHHPRIGDKVSLKEKFSGQEQAGIGQATEEVIEQLAQANEAYFQKFGFIYLISATGKSAVELLRTLQDRLNHKAEDELQVAMREHFKIMIIRFQKALYASDWSWLPKSQLTTHILDTTLGRPASNVCIRLYDASNTCMALGRTNSDGRIADMLPATCVLNPGIYRLLFDTASYYSGHEAFYPEVSISFLISDAAHYHIPLLLSPFGYSTYRGS